LKVSDRLLTLDGRWTDSLADLYQAASQVKPGTPVQVVVRRGKKVLTFTVRPVSGL
jgi:S1-C subfamily serine protease